MKVILASKNSKFVEIAYRARKIMTFSFVILSLELTLINKNFDDFIKYNGSKVTLIKNYIHTQYDAGSINGYELTVENSCRCSQRTCLKQMNILQV